ncbi:hypothetical protein [Chryseobacterium aurantiacum]|uniref:hypothetical protein n=1 Tax=Chryseobacterium aurantiacum TaxID=2116499 RepID=UPI000D13DD0E|nr:hypothetical protein [Chryseobacterium aurantiacum]
MVYTSTVLEVVKTRIFYISGTDTQIFTDSDMNSPAATPPPNNLVTFTTAPIINNGNIITANPDSSFTINISGIYDISSFVNYNPMATTVGIPNISYNTRAFLNVKIQKSVNNGVTWANMIGSRTAWGENAAGTLKTAALLGTPVQLNQGERIRVVVANPFDSSSNNNHCGGGDCSISADPANSLPVSKGLLLKLLDYNKID